MASKRNWMYRLITIYSVTLIVIITLFSLVVGFVFAREKQLQVNDVIEETSSQLEELIDQNQRKVNQLTSNLSRERTDFDNLRLFFSMTSSEYLSYVLGKTVNEYGYLPKQVEDFYFSDDAINSVTINFDDYQERYYSTVHNKAGIKTKEVRPSSGLTFHQYLKNPDTFQVVGSVQMTIGNAQIDQLIAKYSESVKTHVFILSDTNQLIYESDTSELNQLITSQLKDGNGLSSKLFANYYMSRVAVSEKEIWTLVSRHETQKASLKVFASFLLFSFVIDAVLLILLYRLFNKYVNEVNDIVTSVNKVTEGSLTARISLRDKQAELADISRGINDMLESMNLYIKENYELELQQKDADFRALQAQINPHFMYNTLEYIRMYAYSEGMKELANVVYSFASILRNNISQDRLISVEKELTFIEQYVYLYQMRYPENIAYSFKIEDSIKSVEIPKFCIQPLVENYFSHGIDYSRVDNAISVLAYKEDHHLIIEIKDNGAGMTKERLNVINRYLRGEGQYPFQSIGIKNVNERLQIVFGNRYHMVYQPLEAGGLMIVVSVKLEEGE